MGIFSWFSGVSFTRLMLLTTLLKWRPMLTSLQNSKPDYETLLAKLSTEIDEARVHLSEVRLRERRWSLLVNLYGIALWAVLVGLWWTRHLPLGLLGWSSDGMEAKIVGTSIVAAAPVLYVTPRPLIARGI